MKYETRGVYVVTPSGQGSYLRMAKYWTIAIYWVILRLIQELICHNL